MDENGTSEILYNGEFKHGIDAKRRIQVPARWRPKAEAFEFSVLFWPKNPAGPCLRVLTPMKMKQFLRELDEMGRGDPNKEALRRFVGRESAQVELDKAGRLCLPEGLATKAGIKDEAILVGMLDRFEIWSLEGFEAVRKADDVLALPALKGMD